MLVSYYLALTLSTAQLPPKTTEAIPVVEAAAFTPPKSDVPRGTRGSGTR